MTRSRSVRHRLQGVVFLVVLALLLGLAVAVYQKAFTPVAHVTLHTDTVGSQLREASDVKVRGVLVGEVRSVEATPQGATLDLAIDPSYLDQIPADVRARLLPKTLFGERFVSLVLPEEPSTEHLAAGDVITQDRSENAIELQRVIDDLLPLLQAVQPQDLSYTLSALATALRGRGEALGENLASVGEYFAQVNTVLPELQEDISLLADFAQTYDSASEDLLDVLDNLAVVNTTVVDQSEQLRRTFTVVDSSSTTVASFLRQNEESLISLAASSRPVLALFAEYSPEYPCLLDGLSRFNPMISEAFGADGDPALNLNIVVSFPPRDPYVAGDQPAYVAHSGPDCRDLNRIDALIAGAQDGQYHCPEAIPDGVDSPDVPSGGTGCQASASTASSASLLDNQCSLAGSPAETAFVRNLLAYQRGTDPSEVSDLSVATLAPLLRGTQVMLR